MMHVNLIPRERRRRRRERIRLRRWITAAAAYAFFLVVALVASRLAGSGDHRSLREDIEHAQTALASGEAAVALLDAELTQAAVRLAANRAIGDQPDWSILLALLSDTRGDEIVLRRVLVRADGNEPGGRASRGAGAADADAMPVSIDPTTTVELQGLARAQRDVSQYLLRMESVPLFRDVKLHDSRREPFVSSHAIAFRLDFVLDPTEGIEP